MFIRRPYFLAHFTLYGKEQRGLSAGKRLNATGVISQDARLEKVAEVAGAISVFSSKQ